MPHSAIPFGFEACVLSRASSILAYWDHGFVCRYANEAYAAWFGHTPASIAGMRLQDVLGEAAFEVTRPYVDGAFAGQDQPCQCNSPGAPHGRHGLTRYQPDIVGSKLVGYIAEIRDISPLRIAETALDRLKLAVDAAHLGLWHWDLDTDQVTWGNDWPHMILGIPTSDATPVASRLIREFLTAEQDSELYFVIRKALCRQESFRFLGQIKRRQDGQPRWIEMIGGSEGAGALNGTIMDVTDRIEAEEALRKAAGALSELDMRKNDFLAMLGHELRNCLAPLQSGVHAITVAPGEVVPPKIQEVMSRQVKHLGRLVDDIYDIRKISTGALRLDLQLVPLRQAVDAGIEMCRSLVERSRHTLRCHFSDEPINVRGDPVRLAQIFSNIIGNAVKFTPPGGSIDIRMEVERDMGVVSISDNGIGMTETELQAVFGLYARASDRNCRAADGLGIGLHLVRTLTELQGGNVEARSGGPGHGTTLTVRLPMA